MSEFEKSRLERLKRSIHSRTGVSRDMRGDLTVTPKSQSEEWQESDVSLPRLSEDEKLRSGSGLMRKIFITSVLFFVVAIAASLYFLFGGSNLISGENVTIEVSGPVSVSGGDSVSLDIFVQNGNALDLELVDLAIVYPEGVTAPGEPTQRVSRFREQIGDIASGGVGRKTVRFDLYGEEGEVKDIKITAEYRVEGSNAIFYKEKVYDLLISSSPITFNVASLDEVSSGQEFEIAIEVSSNTDELLKNIVVKAEYPPGWAYKTADPAPESDNMTWVLGDVAPESRRVIKVRGVLTGEDASERVFRFRIGSNNGTDRRTIATTLGSREHVLLIDKPFVSLDFVLAGDEGSGDYAAEPRRSLRSEFFYVNNTNTTILDAVLTVNLTGSALDKLAVNPDRGFYRSVDSTITWDKTTNPELAELAPGESGRVSFNFVPQSPIQNGGSYAKNPEVTLKGSLKARRISDRRVSEDVVSGATRKIKVASQPSIAARLVKTTGPFMNQGPIPPVADTETEYTAIITLRNTSNNLGNGKVVMSLPSYITWKDEVFPQNESVEYSRSRNEIVWDIGAIPANVGYGLPAREMAFQIGLTPSIAQRGTAPQIIRQIIFTGIDDFTGGSVELEAEGLDTRIESDPAYVGGAEYVQQ